MLPLEQAVEDFLTSIRGVIGHVGLSNVTSAQVEEALGICDIVCVQDQYNLEAPR